MVTWASNNPDDEIRRKRKKVSFFITKKINVEFQDNRLAKVTPKKTDQNDKKKYVVTFIYRHIKFLTNVYAHNVRLSEDYK